MTKETRALPALELRVVEEDGKPHLEGYAVKWDSLSENLGGFRERFARRAFADSLEQDDIRVQWQHDGRYVFGRVQAGTARVWEDDTGLAYRATPPDAQWARDAIESIRRGDVDQNSFAFAVPEPEGEKWERQGDGTAIRTVLRARLYEVGPQTNPAYPDTTVAVRSLEQFAHTEAPPADTEQQPEHSEPAPDHSVLRAKIRLATSS